MSLRTAPGFQRLAGCCADADLTHAMELCRGSLWARLAHRARTCRSAEAAVPSAVQAPSKAEAATQCLNAMITDALQHVPHCLEYLELLRHKKVRLPTHSRSV